MNDKSLTIKDVLKWRKKYNSLTRKSLTLEGYRKFANALVEEFPNTDTKNLDIILKGDVIKVLEVLEREVERQEANKKEGK